MSFDDYSKAYKAGKKEYQRHLAEGSYPYLQALDESISHIGIGSKLRFTADSVGADSGNKKYRPQDSLCAQLYAPSGSAFGICRQMDQSLRLPSERRYQGTSDRLRIYGTLLYRGRKQAGQCPEIF